MLPTGMLPTAVMAAVLLAGAIPAGAQSLGAAKGAVFIGRPLDVVVASTVEGEDAAALCAEARVRYGETSLPASDVALSVVRDDPRGPGLRVRTRTPVDEPFVVIDIKVGCSTPFVRRYTLLPFYSREVGDNQFLVATPGSNEQTVGRPVAEVATEGIAQAIDHSVNPPRESARGSRPRSQRLQGGVSATGNKAITRGWGERYAFALSDAYVMPPSEGGRLTVEPLVFENDEAFLKFLLGRAQQDQESDSDLALQRSSNQELERELERLRSELADLQSRQPQTAPSKSSDSTGFTEIELIVAFGVGALLAGLIGWHVNRRRPGPVDRFEKGSGQLSEFSSSEKDLRNASQSKVYDRLRGWFARVAEQWRAGKGSLRLSGLLVEGADAGALSAAGRLYPAEGASSDKSNLAQTSIKSETETRGKNLDLEVAEASDWVTVAHVDARPPSPADIKADAATHPYAVAFNSASITGQADVADAHDSAFEPAPVAALDLAALHELWERVDFFEDLGQIADAVAALRSFVLAHPRASEAPYLRWWRLASEHGLDARLAQATYEQHYHRLLQGDGRRGTLLDDAALLQRLQAEWPGQQARATVEQALASQPDAEGQALLAVRSLAAFDDLITLHGVLDLLPLLPLTEADPAAPAAAPKADDHVIEFDLSGWTLPPAPPPAAAR